MIVLDTHIWVWWAHADARLTPGVLAFLNECSDRSGLAVSAISCWEVAKLVEHGRLSLPVAVETWLGTALSYPGLQLVPLSPEIAVESTRLPGLFHRDPADQIIVATARVLNLPLATADLKILKYPHVATVQCGSG